MRAIRSFIWLSLIAATIFVVHGYADLDSYISLNQYAAGTERMPFQGRMLMTFPLRLAERSAGLQRWTQGRPGLSSAEMTVVIAVGTVSVLATGWMITGLFRKISTRQYLPYLPYAILLGACLVSFRLGFFSFPYDLPSMAFFTAGIYLIFMRRFWALAVLFPIATLNRETTLFLIPLLALDEMADGDCFDGARLFRPAAVGKLILLTAMWIAIELYVRYHFRYNPTEMKSHVMLNIGLLKRPSLWPNILSPCCFLLPLVLLLRKKIENSRIRAYLWMIPLFLTFMFVYGSIIETRIYGELFGLVGLAATLILEEGIARKKAVISDGSTSASTGG